MLNFTSPYKTSLYPNINNYEIKINLYKTIHYPTKRHITNPNMTKQHEEYDYLTALIVFNLNLPKLPLFVGLNDPIPTYCPAYSTILFTVSFVIVSLST